ncbi:MAG: hypothetical protein U0271_03110 [Polyangiaceae bacterium]
MLRNRLFLALSATPLLLYALVAALILKGEVVWAFLPHPIILAMSVLWAVAKKNPKPTLVEGVARVEPAALVLPDGERVPRAALRQGFVSKGVDAARVILFGPLVPIELRVDDEASGRRLLEALELDATQQAATFKGQSRLARTPLRSRVAALCGLWVPALASLLGALLTRPHGPNPASPTLGLTLLFAGIALLFLPIALVAVAGRPTRISVGVDGIETVWLGRRRFFSFARVKDVEMLAAEFGGPKVPRGVVLVMDDGRREPLPLTLDNLVDGEAERLMARIQQALEARRARAAIPVELLDAMDNPSVEQVRVLLRIGSGADAGPRSAPTPPEVLAALLEDAGASASVRASAAVALTADADPTSRERIRRAARQVASPRLRVALERAACVDRDEVALAEALAAVADEEPRRARRT